MDTRADDLRKTIHEIRAHAERVSATLYALADRMDAEAARPKPSGEPARYGVYNGEAWMMDPDGWPMLFDTRAGAAGLLRNLRKDSPSGFADSFAARVGEDGLPVKTPPEVDEFKGVLMSEIDKRIEMHAAEVTESKPAAPKTPRQKAGIFCTCSDGVYRRIADLDLSDDEVRRTLNVASPPELSVRFTVD